MTFYLVLLDYKNAIYAPSLFLLSTLNEMLRGNKFWQTNTNMCN